MATLTRLDCGEIRGDLAIFEDGSEGKVTLPVTAWLVRHPRGNVLFDTGMPVSLPGASDRTDIFPEFVTTRFGAHDAVGAQLIANSQDPKRVDFVVLSHLHFDHVGGLSDVPNATVVVQRKEWETNLIGPQQRYTLNPSEEFDLKHEPHLIDGEHDLFGDDSVVCIPTPGHTPGHQSLRVRLSTGEQVVLASDCCLFSRTIDSAVLPTFGFDLDEQRHSLAYLKRCRDNGAMIIPGHDMEFVSHLPRVLGTDDST